jgi:hypothetical protein
MEEWRDSKLYVMNEIHALKENECLHTQQLYDLRVEFAILKAKVVVWGAIASVVGASIGSFLVGVLLKYA